MIAAINKELKVGIEKSTSQTVKLSNPLKNSVSTGPKSLSLW